MAPAAHLRRWVAVFVLVLAVGSLAEERAPEASPGGAAPVSAALASYLSNEQVAAFLQGLVDGKCKSMAQVFSIGKSVQGRDILVLELSDKPGEVEDEPYFKYVANMHGDEALGRQMLLAWAEWLCTASVHEADPLAMRVMTGMHTYLVPSLNPDGYAAGKRENARGADLNRDFPDQFEDGPTMPDAWADREPEAAALMRWALANTSHAGANLHEGALVASLPWDGTVDKATHGQPSPDDATYRWLGAVYATAHGGMAKSAAFAGGVTNGAAWYPVYGGMQDWAYLRAGCMEFTLELDDIKSPPHALLSQRFAEHRQALTALPVAALLSGGVHGHVRDSLGRPLPGAHVLLRALGGNETVSDGSAAGVMPADAAAAAARIARGGVDDAGGPLGLNGWEFPAAVSATHGGYHRPAAPGLYRVLALCPGYESRSHVVLVPDGARDRGGAGFGLGLPAVAEFMLPAVATFSAIRAAGLGGKGGVWTARDWAVLMAVALVKVALCALVPRYLKMTQAEAGSAVAAAAVAAASRAATAAVWGGAACVAYAVACGGWVAGRWRRVAAAADSEPRAAV